MMGWVILRRNFSELNLCWSGVYTFLDTLLLTKRMARVFLMENAAFSYFSFINIKRNFCSRIPSPSVCGQYTNILKTLQNKNKTSFEKLVLKYDVLER